MITRRCGNHAALTLLGWEGQQRVARAAFLEAAGPLQILHFAIDLQSGRFRERNAQRARRVNDGSVDSPRRRFYIAECDGCAHRRRLGALSREGNAAIPTDAIEFAVRADE